MRDLGRNYGKGLQLINILRDAGSDWKNGRCYLPEEQLHEDGISPNDAGRDPARLEPILQKWREKAEKNIASGLEYVCAVRPARVRIATALPALIGARTLALLREAGPTVFRQRIKVPRSEVYRIIALTVISIGKPKRLEAIFKELSG